MRVLNLLNSIVIEIEKNKRKYYFFLNSGFPYSFSYDFNSINNIDLKIDSVFELNLRNKPTDLKELSEIFGVKFSGILGIDFFHCFRNLSIDFNSKKIDFNVKNFIPNYEINLVNNRPLMINIAIENDTNIGDCLIDTGASQCMYFTNNLEGEYMKNKGWVFPSSPGPMVIDYYKDIDLYIKGMLYGRFIFGKPRDLPKMPLSYIIGLNFLTDYICMFDLENNKFKLKKSIRQKLMNTQPQYTLGFQIKIVYGEIIVTNKLEGCNLKININDRIVIPGLDMKNVEIVNQIYNKLLFLNNDYEVELIVNGKKGFYKPFAFFN